MVSLVTASALCVGVVLSAWAFADSERRFVIDIGPRIPARDVIIGTPVPSIRAAERALGIHIPRPQSWAANDDMIRSVSINVRNREVGITYAPLSVFGLTPYGRVQVTIEFRGRLYATAAGYWRWALEEVHSLGSIASLSEVAGWPAVIMQGNFGGDCDHPTVGEEGCAPPQHNPTALLMQFERTNVSIYGPGAWDTSTIVAVADTLR